MSVSRLELNPYHERNDITRRETKTEHLSEKRFQSVDVGCVVKEDVRVESDDGQLRQRSVTHTQSCSLILACSCNK